MPHKDIEARRLYHKEYYKKHKLKVDTYRQQYREENPLKEKEWQNSYRSSSVEKRKQYVLKYRYNLTLEQVSELLEIQENKCAICSRSFNNIAYAVDHSHTTKKVRGLLCNSCNTTLGIMGDEIKEITNKYNQMMEYLKE